MRILTTVVALLLATATAFGQNFTSPDAEVVQVAEEARTASAVFWTGEPLPHDWGEPCPITIKSGPASGFSTFTFHGGEVFGWKMTIQAPDRVTLLESIVPHEVDHTVRASLIRRPIPRWLDEGMATIREGEAEHLRLRKLDTLKVTRIDSAFLDEMEYAENGQAVRYQYAVGWSLCEFLALNGGQQKLFNFAADPREPSAKLAEFYGADVEKRFLDWRAARPGDCSDCPTHGDNVVAECQDKRLLLEVWSTTWCGPCLRFDADYKTDARFRAWLTTYFRVVPINADQHKEFAERLGAKGVPFFRLPQIEKIVEGYEGPKDLADKLTAAVRGNQWEPATEPPPPSVEAAPPPPVKETPPPLSAPPPAVKPPMGPTFPDPPVAPVQESPPVEDTPPPPKTEEPEDADNPGPPVRPVDNGGVQPGPDVSGPPDVPRQPLSGVLWGVVTTAIEVATGAAPYAAIATGLGIPVWAVWLGVRIVRRRLRRRSEKRREGAVETKAPFPRRLDEARQQRELAYEVERRLPEYDAAVGRIVSDEIELRKQHGPPEEKAVLSEFWLAVRDRVDTLLPASTKEYIPKD